MNHQIKNERLLALNLRAKHRSILADGQVEDLHDLIEGETNLFEGMEEILASIDAHEAYVEALKIQQDKLAKRKSLITGRVNKMRNLLLGALVDSGLKKKEFAAGTVGTCELSPKVLITDETALPHHLLRATTAPDKAAIKQALENGERVTGAMLSNGGATLTIRRN